MRAVIGRKELFLILLVVLGSFIAFKLPVVDTINETTRINASHHISDHQCSRLGPSCAGKLECYDDFDNDRVGLVIQESASNTSGARCVTSIYSEQYCGVFERPVIQDASIPSMGACKPLSVSYLLKDPAKLLQVVNRVIPPPDGEAILRQYNYSSVADVPSSATDPKTPIRDCSFASLTIVNTTYSDTSSNLSIFLANTGTRPIDTAVTVVQGNISIGETRDAYSLATGDHLSLTVDVSQRPNRITVTSTDCPNVTDTTTNVTVK